MFDIMFTLSYLILGNIYVCYSQDWKTGLVIIYFGILWLYKELIGEPY